MNLLSWLDRKTLRMVWRVEKDGCSAHLIGTAHFFPYSFRRALTCLIRDVTTVVFEGPLDETSSAQIVEYGRQGKNIPSFVDALTPETIQEIDHILRDRLDGQSSEVWLYSVVGRKPIYFETFTQGVRPWAAFFSIWQTYLGWDYSVDLEGYQIACKLGKQVQFLETLDEQLAVLDNIPLDRIAWQLNDVKNWEAYKDEYVRTFLAGDLEKMITLSARIATRGPVIVGARDQIFFDRIKPILEQEDTLAFVGFPHIPGMLKLFHDDGYTSTQVSV